MRVLQFSGGLDSIAALLVLRPMWKDLTVVWVDTQASYPATAELVRKIAELPVADVITVKGDQPAWTAEHGYPVDVVPVRSTRIGHAIHKTVGPRFVSYLECCAANIWHPMHREMKRLGATVVYRGQRRGEKKTAPINSGHVFEGVTYVFPIEEWTRREVREYVAKEAPQLFPAYYNEGEDSSRDCWNCTAYLEDNAQRIRNLPPEKRENVHARLRLLTAALEAEKQLLTEASHG